MDDGDQNERLESPELRVFLLWWTIRVGQIKLITVYWFGGITARMQDDWICYDEDLSKYAFAMLNHFKDCSADGVSCRRPLTDTWRYTILEVGVPGDYIGYD